MCKGTRGIKEISQNVIAFCKQNVLQTFVLYIENSSHAFIPNLDLKRWSMNIFEFQFNDAASVRRIQKRVICIVVKCGKFAEILPLLKSTFTYYAHYMWRGGNFYKHANVYSKSYLFQNYAGNETCFRLCCDLKNNPNANTIMLLYMQYFYSTEWFIFLEYLIDKSETYKFYLGSKFYSISCVLQHSRRCAVCKFTLYLQ